MDGSSWAVLIIVALWFCYEIDRARKREGKQGLPVLGNIFDSISVNVREEIVNADASQANIKTASTQKSDSKMRSRKKKRSHSTRRSKHGSSTRKRRKHKSTRSKRKSQGSESTTKSESKMITRHI
ncbi:hypothetical protein DdX_20550 [Ditylenchus destructor]|uniref:Uncharacterized protein n=1 Tax=Ditylenchus destructor TaxID=166010 RepID=A0AAD4MKL2_9BILA|nr:hypothetical protein DdX_20550 [Ditylenchus destructor]